MYKTIKMLRQACQMKQYEFAHRVGITSMNLRSIESGEKRKISLETFEKIAKAL